MTSSTVLRVGLGMALLGIALTAHVVARAQSGPAWEIPAVAARQLQLVPLLSLLLAIVAAIAGAVRRGFGDLSRFVRFAFWLVVGLSFLAPLIVWLLEPGQWPVTHSALSALARRLPVAVWVVCALVFWSIGIHLSRK